MFLLQPLWLCTTLVTGLLSLSSYAAPVAKRAEQCAVAKYSSKPRVFVLTDISNEPDDQMSLVRFLTYSNEFQVEGISAVTSVWLNDTVDTPTIREVIKAYGKVVGNLNSNVPSAGQYPTQKELLSKVYHGKAVYGLEALKNSTLSSAASALIKSVDASDEPLYITVWGGANVIAEALNHVQSHRTTTQVATFVSKMRIYSISDQDNSGPWIRVNFPSIWYIVSLHGFNSYRSATWTGISGEEYYRFDLGGPNTTIVTNSWLETNIRVGELGSYYLNYSYIMEGDTPSFLYLIPNGLGDPEHPEWGSWGGRYRPDDLSRQNSQVFGDVVDIAEGVDGNEYLSPQASIWRWREAFQLDFAQRMQWTINSDYSSTNHEPVAILNDTCGPKSYQLTYKYGDNITLDASSSWDPDDDELTFKWEHYRDVIPSSTTTFPYGEQDTVSKNVTFNALNDQGSKVEVIPLMNDTLHIILTVTDGTMPAYRRVILYPTA